MHGLHIDELVSDKRQYFYSYRGYIGLKPITVYSMTDSAVLDWFGKPGSPDYVKNYKTWEVYKGAQPLQFAMGPPKVSSKERSRPIGKAD